MGEERRHVRLAIIAGASPEALQRSVDSVRHLIDSALVVIAPRAYTSLPDEGFGYCALETKVIQAPAIATMNRSDLVRLAEEDEIVDWILVVTAGDTIPSSVRVADLPLHERGDLIALENAIFVRARSGFRISDSET